MAHALWTLIPQPIALPQPEEANYEACTASVTIETNRNMQWGYSSSREGSPLPLPDIELGDRSAFEVFLQNQLRIDIQRRIEEML
ncbi:MAG: hypothetical protein ABSB35_28585 [Bryobacteraceae bacterium]|jgi:hypothetical protein